MKKVIPLTLTSPTRGEETGKGAPRAHAAVEKSSFMLARSNWIPTSVGIVFLFLFIYLLTVVVNIATLNASEQ